MDKIYEIFLCSKDNIQAEIPDGTFKKNQIIRNPELLFATCYLLYANFVKCNGALRLMLKQVELPLSKEQFSPQQAMLKQAITNCRYIETGKKMQSFIRAISTHFCPPL